MPKLTKTSQFLNVLNVRIVSWRPYKLKIRHFAVWIRDDWSLCLYVPLSSSFYHSISKCPVPTHCCKAAQILLLLFFLNLKLPVSRFLFTEQLYLISITIFWLDRAYFKTILGLINVKLHITAYKDLWKKTLHLCNLLSWFYKWMCFVVKELENSNLRVWGSGERLCSLLLLSLGIQYLLKWNICIITQYCEQISPRLHTEKKKR